MGKIIDIAKKNLKEVAENAIEFAVLPLKIPQALASEGGGALSTGKNPKLAMVVFPFAVAASAITSTIALGLFALALPSTVIDMIITATGMDNEEPKTEELDTVSSSYAVISEKTKTENTASESSLDEEPVDNLATIPLYYADDEDNEPTSSHTP